MELVEYTKLCNRTCAKLKDLEADNLHMILGMVTEIGELADVFKKNMAYNKQIDWINVQEEIGDLMFYIAMFCSKNNFNLNEILKNNVDKLRARYPDKFTEENALNRNLEVERKILEELGF